ncbi:MAG: hypothetical protein KDI13_07155 [Alphaproteobacteria bacterium]|nr:hypothetical protein [Alphaproteobacteria bacterium]
MTVVAGGMPEFLGKMFHRVAQPLLEFKGRKRINPALDSFFAEINFQTEEETIRPVNVEKAKQAFMRLCRDMDWVLVEQSFLELLDEKSGDKSLRKDGETPNWYHEFRNLLPTLSLLRSGIYTLDNLKDHGDIEALLTSKLRHDSYEDFGKTPTLGIYAPLEKRLHEKHADGSISEDELLIGRRRATLASLIVKTVSSKTHQWEVDSAGKTKWQEVPFFEGRMDDYFRGTLVHLFSYDLKITDTIEGASTRIMPNKFFGDNTFSQDENLAFTRKRNFLFSTIPMSEEAYKRWPKMKKAIRSLDAMLGLNMTMLNVVNNFFDKSSEFNPTRTVPMNVARFLPHALTAWEHVPKGYQPHIIMLERLEKVAHKGQSLADLKGDPNIEGIVRMRQVLENSIYPAMIPLIGDRRGSLLELSDEGADHMRMYLDKLS